jgi:hypothetical protein
VIADQYIEASALPSNESMELTRRFLRFSGHPELTIQECNYAESKPKNDLPI